MSARPWWIAQLALGIVLVVAAIVTWVIPFPNNGTWGYLGVTPGIALLRFLVPVLAISLLVNALLLSVRSNVELAPGERTLLLVQFVGIPVAIVLAFVPAGTAVYAVASVISGVLVLGLLMLGFAVAVVVIANWRVPTRRPVRRR